MLEIDPNARGPTLPFMARKSKKTTPKKESVGERIQRFRKARGLTQTEFGKLLGVSQRVVTYYESQGGSLSPELLVKFAEALGVSTDALLGSERQPKRAAAFAPENPRLWRRFKRVEELPDHDRKAVLKMIEALADRVGKRRAS